MGKGNVRQRLISVFLQELEERTSSMERDLLALEAGDFEEKHGELVRNILRAAHSLKGAARLVELPAIETVCHWMEEILAFAQNGSLTLGQEQINLLLRSSDAIASAAPALSTGEDPPTGDLDTLTVQLLELVSRASVPSLHQFDGDESPSVHAPIPSNKIAEAPEPAPNLGAAPSASVSVTANNRMVSVDASRLDALLVQDGELHLARAQAGERIDQLARLHQLLWKANRKHVAVEPRRTRLRPLNGRSTKPDTEPESKSAESGSSFLPRLERELQQLLAGLNADRRAVHKAATALNNEIRNARLQEFSAACDGLDRFVRDLAIDSAKRVQLKIGGGQLEIDRAIIQELRDIIRHLVRNAMDHGLETVEERKALGKPEKGTIEVSAAFVRDRIKVTVKDDGRGLDAQAISKTAARLGVVESEEPEQARRLIFEPGLSTAKKTSRISGRGVGLDAVRVRVEAMRGSINVDYEDQCGTTFTILVPLTVGTIRAILVRAGSQLFALDSAAIRQVFFFSADSITESGGRLAIIHNQKSMPILDLRQWLHLEPNPRQNRTDRQLAVELNEVGKDVAIQVDEIVSDGEFLVRSLGPRLRDVRDFAGGIVLPDGRIALVLNAAALGDGAHEGATRQSVSGKASAKQRKFKLLIVDDSLTTRTLEKTILEAAGYEVSVAADGAEAWNLLSTQSPDLIIADVDMPEMDGFTLTEKVRQSADFRDVPVILLTAREKEEDRRRGMAAGADAYLIKSAFDQRALLNTIGQML